jgi:hypothetical protein
LLEVVAIGRKNAEKDPDTISSVKVFFPTSMIKKATGDEHKFCTTLMEKIVGEIEIINSNLISDQFFTVYAA